MRTVYQVLDKIKSKLRSSPNIHTVSFGDFFIPSELIINCYIL